MLSLTATVQAATRTVTSTADSGAGTLRAAINYANAGDTINFASDVSEVVLTSGQLIIFKNLNINATNANKVTVRRSSSVGTPQFRIFLVSGGVAVRMSNLTISNGYSAEGRGGAIWNNVSRVNLNKCILSGNTAAGGGDSYGGAIFSLGGTLNLNNCTVSGNASRGAGSSIYGGGIYATQATTNLINCTLSGNSTSGSSIYGGGGGGLFNNQGTANLTNCTFSGNSASGASSSFGGGLVNAAGILAVTNCTFSGNSVSAPDFSDGGGLYLSGTGSSLKNTIVSGNSATTNPDIFGDLAANDNNLIGGDAKLGPLQDNGGPTQTMALLPGSPAIDAGTNSGAPGADQRGVPRPQPTGGMVDIGAFEAEQAQGSGTLVVNVTDDANDGACDVGHCSLREAITAANADVDESAIAFDIPGAGPHIIQLDGVLPFLQTAMSITNLSGENITVRGEGSSDPYRIFVISSLAINGMPVSISSLTISNGYVSQGDGGGIYNSFGTVSLANCTINGNTASGRDNTFGGGIHNLGTLNLNSCTLSGNTASGNFVGSGGGLGNYGTANLTNCTISGNTSSNTNDGPLSRGGGIFNNGGLTLTNCTISRNAATSFAGYGGGLFTNSFANLRNTIVSGNTAVNNPDVYGTLATDDSNLIGGAARLGPLQDNGGLTKTMALLPGSPAIGAGNDAVAPIKDQRDYSRNGRSDIGAVEYNGVPPIAYRVDALIKRGGESTAAYALDNVYQLTPSGTQIERQSVTGGVAAIYQIMVQNDTTEERTFRVKAGVSAGAGWIIVYKSGTTDISTAIRSGEGYTTRLLAPGRSEIITVRMIPASGAVNIKSTTLKIFLGSMDKITRDVVNATTTLTGSSAGTDL